jgi:hypothetical protein
LGFLRLGGSGYERRLRRRLFRGRLRLCRDARRLDGGRRALERLRGLERWLLDDRRRLVDGRRRGRQRDRLGVHGDRRGRRRGLFGRLGNEQRFIELLDDRHRRRHREQVPAAALVAGQPLVGAGDEVVQEVVHALAPEGAAALGGCRHRRGGRRLARRLLARALIRHL